MVKTHEILTMIENYFNDINCNSDKGLMSCEASVELNPMRVEVTFFNSDLSEDKYTIKAELLA